MKINVKKKVKANPFDDNFMVLVPDEKKNEKYNDVEMTDSNIDANLINITSESYISKDIVSTENTNKTIDELTLNDA